MVKIYYYKSEGIYDPRDIIYIAKLKKKKKSTWNGEDPYSNLFKRLSLKKKKKGKKMLEIICELKLHIVIFMKYTSRIML